ncbi:MAG: alpha/beta fold hydrolase [Betaproteobacteria bacterium]|nr:alpha/beta fold hydrolase [Betaproteobacteria bacterium]
MSLHVESHGSGAPLVLIHGWGMHGGIWGSVVPQLAQRFRVHCVDLPGHGQSLFPSPMNGRGSGRGQFAANPLPQPLSRLRERGVELLDEIVGQLVAQFDESLTVCGWSLGGQVALRWAQLAPVQVQRLVLVSSTPCFVERGDWLCGMAQAALQQFAAELERDYAATLRRFLALQVRGSENERELLLTLREGLFSRGEPGLAALRGGLEILRDTDLRAELPAIRQPALVIAGERDKLTPPEASLYLAQALPDARVEEIAGAAHTPFLSHPQIFLQHINEFLA